MRKAMGRVLVGLGLWIVLCELFLIVLRQLKCKRTLPTPQEDGQVEPVSPTPDPPQDLTAVLPTWKHCCACGEYAHTVALDCPCGGQSRIVSQSQLARAFTVQWAAAEAIPVEEQEAFAGFVLRYEELANRFVPVDIALRLYHLSRAQDEVAR